MNEDGKIVAGDGNAELTYRKAPLPTAEELSQYNKVVPGLAETIVSEFQKQGSHRRWMEKLLVIGQLYLGPVLAVTVICLALGFGYKLVINDKPIAGFVTGLTPLALVGGLFVWNKRKDERNEKSKKE